MDDVKKIRIQVDVDEGVAGEARVVVRLIDRQYPQHEIAAAYLSGSEAVKVGNSLQSAGEQILQD